MFQENAPAPRRSAKSLAVSLVVHAAGILLLFILSIHTKPSYVPSRLVHVSLGLPFREDRPAPVPKPQRVRLPPPHSTAKLSFAVPTRVDPPVPILTVAEIPRISVPTPERPRIESQIPAPVLKPEAVIKASGFTAFDPLPTREFIPRATLPAASGFDTAAATEAAPRRGPLAHASGFADANESAPPAPTRAASVGESFAQAVIATPVAGAVHAAPATANLIPVEILDKPRPIYTEEARRLLIQGEVVLEVLFESSAHVRVRRVVRGLGHGLDESAIAAASQIRFRPARREGATVDFAAVVHISFQLAD